MLSSLHIICIILSIFICPIYVNMMKRIKEDKPVNGHILTLSAFIFFFVSIVLRNME